MPPVVRTSLSTVVGALRSIFWGGLLVILDIKFSEATNGRGLQFDLLNDTLGWILILIGVVRIRRIDADPLFRRRMTFVVWVATLSLFNSLRTFTVGVDWPGWLEAASTVLGICDLIAIVFFCSSMIFLSSETGLWRSELSWKTSRVLCIVIYVVPLGFLYGAGLIGQLTNEEFHFNLGGAGLLLVPVFLIPLIHLFISTSRMRREIQDETIQG